MKNPKDFKSSAPKMVNGVNIIQKNVDTDLSKGEGTKRPGKPLKIVQVAMGTPFTEVIGIENKETMYQSNEMAMQKKSYKEEIDSDIEENISEKERKYILGNSENENKYEDEYFCYLASESGDDSHSEGETHEKVIHAKPK
ncbi:hypothetical protein JTB14_016336 [Gonioctena quinquepunctata]|nr:hypothetical protein JTB14_016336 [Gonioctena quinquepunctata]